MITDFLIYNKKNIFYLFKYYDIKSDYKHQKNNKTDYKHILYIALIIISAVVIILILIAFGIYYIKQKKRERNENNEKRNKLNSKKGSSESIDVLIEKNGNQLREDTIQLKQQIENQEQQMQEQLQKQQEELQKQQEQLKQQQYNLQHLQQIKQQLEQFESTSLTESKSNKKSKAQEVSEERILQQNQNHSTDLNPSYSLGHSTVAINHGTIQRNNAVTSLPDSKSSENNLVLDYSLSDRKSSENNLVLNYSLPNRKSSENNLVLDYSNIPSTSIYDDDESPPDYEEVVNEKKNILEKNKNDF